MIPVNQPLFEARHYRSTDGERLYRIFYDGHNLLFVCIGGKRTIRPGGMADLMCSIAGALSKYIDPTLPKKIEEKVLYWISGRDELLLERLKHATPQQMMTRCPGSHILALGQMSEVTLQGKASQIRYGFHFANWIFKDHLGVTHYFMLETEENFCYAYQWLPQLFGSRLQRDDAMVAKAEDPFFQYTMGFYFHHLQRNYEIARYWHTLAAQQGAMPSLRQLGHYAEEGIGVEQSYTEAADWYRKAAEFGEMEAQMALAALYEKGLGVEQDYAQAVHWTQLAAEQELPEANFSMGHYCEHGLGVAQDIQTALLWYRQALKFGHPQAEEVINRLEATTALEVKRS
ncbi:MAG: sel1 repeat family protein [Magnetococcales bacterium]|nr:sel1 repeat family protein [Magnetococcales bacterium]NGZ27367.1 sel1 repeat family protein [Magnetococcales bacterium]